MSAAFDINSIAPYFRLADALQVDGIARRDCMQWIKDQYADEFIGEILPATLGESELTPQEVRDRWFMRYSHHVISALGWPTVAAMFNLETSND
jgi:hypothetical protein